VSAVAEAPAHLQTVKKPAFPFTRLAGQEEMKLALLLNVVDPSIGGVLIMGDRGTGKSVAVRSLVDLLPMIDVVKDDPFNSHPTGAAAQSSGAWGLQGREPRRQPAAGSRLLRCPKSRPLPELLPANLQTPS
jgi:Mg-chelatase subunit ChlI